jgi:glutamine cyclotransferase
LDWILGTQLFVPKSSAGEKAYSVSDNNNDSTSDTNSNSKEATTRQSVDEEQEPTASSETTPPPRPRKKSSMKSTWRQHAGKFTVVDKLAHNPQSFTQGLSYHDGVLYESTGNYKESKVIKLNPVTGKELQAPQAMPDTYFGEGMTHYIDQNDGGRLKLIQLTYKEKTGFIYDAETLKVLKTFSYDNMLVTGEGWGITHDPLTNTFLVSDGSSWIYVWDDTTLKEIRRVQVTLPQQHRGADGAGAEQPPNKIIDHINELEIDPFDNYQTMLANVWYNDVIVRIDVATGTITHIYDFTSLWPHSERPRAPNGNGMPVVDCFNGIAATDVPDEYYVTGKWWPHMYRVRLH